MLRRLAIAIACAVPLALVSAGGAQAATRSFDEGTGDVWTLGENPNTQVTNREQGDIVRTTITHAQRAVVVRTKFVQLNREGRRVIVVTQLRTNTGLARAVSLDASRKPATNRWRGKATIERPGGGTVECAIAHRIDYAANVAVVRVPRTCLDNPRSVQAKLGVATVTARRFFADNPINGGPTERLPRYTAPVRRG